MSCERYAESLRVSIYAHDLEVLKMYLMSSFAMDVTEIKRIYVTHGTINPTARGFWDKYFSNYSYTMTREIDPNMLGVIHRV